MPNANRRKGYSRRADIPADVLQSLNEGREETITLSEWLAVDMSVLVRHAAIDAGLEDRAGELSAFAASIAEEGVTQRNAKIGAALHDSLSARSDGVDVFERLATHTSDMVRSWAAIAVAADEGIPLDVRLEKARRFAADSNMSVREMAWSSYRSYLARELDWGLELLRPWVADPDPNIRRCAVESTRPRGVWTQHIDRLKDDPGLAVHLLEPVRSDPDRYVARAVGNWINDASKTRPDWVLDLTSRWMTESPTEETRWTVNHALRTLRKQGRVDA